MTMTYLELSSASTPGHVTVNTGASCGMLVFEKMGGKEIPGGGGRRTDLCLIWCDIVAEEDLAVSLGVEDLETASGCEVVEHVGDDARCFEAILIISSASFDFVVHRDVEEGRLWLWRSGEPTLRVRS